MSLESPESADAGRLALLIELLARCGEARIAVSGSSMLPSVWPGDVLTIRRCDATELLRGDLAVFTRGGRLFAHRFVGHDGDRLVTQGDAVPLPDPPVSAAELLGTAVSISRSGKSIAFRTAPGLPARLVAALARRSSGAARLLQRGQALRRRLVVA